MLRDYKSCLLFLIKQSSRNFFIFQENQENPKIICECQGESLDIDNPF